MMKRSVFLNKDFWNNIYIESKIGLDVGVITTPVKEYFDQLNDKTIKILIPDCGNSYETEYLFENKFINTYVVDYSEQALSNFSKRVPSFSKSKLLSNDFFNVQGKFDLIIEETFFCAIDKSRRSDYFV